MKRKANKLVFRDINKVQLVKSRINLLSVPKSDSNICIIYDSTKFSLNGALSDFTFYLPTNRCIIINTKHY